MNDAISDPMETLLNKLGSDNPRLRMLAQLMNQQSDKSNVGQTEKSQAQARKLMDLNLELKRKVQMLRKQRKQILQYLDYFIDVNAAFSAAVGACECWGGDPECSRCHGHGTPGYFNVDQEQFDTYIKPCLSNAHHHTSMEKEKVFADMTTQQ